LLKGPAPDAQLPGLHPPLAHEGISGDEPADAEKEENCFSRSRLPHDGQGFGFSAAERMSCSDTDPHFPQRYSYRGMVFSLSGWPTRSP
jgi:hypothetical protein